MATFLLCWAVVSVIGTFIALTLINSGKRKNRRIEAALQNARGDSRPVAVKS